MKQRRVALARHDKNGNLLIGGPSKPFDDEPATILFIYESISDRPADKDNMVLVGEFDLDSLLDRKGEK